MVFITSCFVHTYINIVEKENMLTSVFAMVTGRDGYKAALHLARPAGQDLL